LFSGIVFLDFFVCITKKLIANICFSRQSAKKKRSNAAIPSLKETKDYKKSTAAILSHPRAHPSLIILFLIIFIFSE